MLRDNEKVPSSTYGATEQTAGRLSEESIIKFQRLYKARFGVELSKEKAFKEGLLLLNMIEEVLKENFKHSRLDGHNN